MVLPVKARSRDYLLGIVPCFCQRLGMGTGHCLSCSKELLKRRSDIVARPPSARELIAAIALDSRKPPAPRMHEEYVLLFERPFFRGALCK